MTIVTLVLAISSNITIAITFKLCDINFIMGLTLLLTTKPTSERIVLPRSALLRFKNQL